MKKATPYLITVLGLFLTLSCTQEMEQPEYNIPTVSSSASNLDARITATSALLSGVLVNESIDKEGELDYHFLLSGNADLSSATRINAKRMSFTGEMDSCQAWARALSPGTTYYYALCVANEKLVLRGEVNSFTTSAKTITRVTTNPMNELSATTATLTGSFEAETACKAVFFLSEHKTYSNATKIKAFVLKDSCYATIDSLQPWTTYYYQLSVSDKYSTVEGDWEILTTGDPIEVNVQGKMVDLGLSVFWSTWNIGAAKPEEFGVRYAWGETKVKQTYSQDTYVYYIDGSYVDIGDDISGTEHDVAHVKWGNGWCMPTSSELEELMKECTWIQDSEKIQVIGPNGNSIYLPSYARTASSNELRLWSSTSNDSHSGAYNLRRGGRGWDIASSSRSQGCYIRPVKRIPLRIDEATEMTSTTATLKGRCTDSNLEYKDIYFKLSADNSFSDSKTMLFPATRDGELCSVIVEGLTASTTYYYRLCATITIIDSQQEYQSGIASFTTAEEEKEDEEKDGTDGEDNNVGDSINTDIRAIDLGLSVKWAEFNIGAIEPEGYGGFYAWGETAEKDCYLPSTYKYSGVDIGSDISGTKYDVARAKWGGAWRMPTSAEMLELKNKCTWKWTSVNGVNGYQITGPNGNSIFLPASGYRYNTDVDHLGMRGSNGYYWTSTKLGTNNAYNLHFYTGWYGVGENGHNPYDGHNIRAVKDK